MKTALELIVQCQKLLSVGIVSQAYGGYPTFLIRPICYGTPSTAGDDARATYNSEWRLWTIGINLMKDCEIWTISSKYLLYTSSNGLLEWD